MQQTIDALFAIPLQQLCVYLLDLQLACCPAAVVGVVTETNAEKAIEELKAYEVQTHTHHISISGLPCCLTSNCTELSGSNRDVCKLHICMAISVMHLLS